MTDSELRSLYRIRFSGGLDLDRKKECWSVLSGYFSTLLERATGKADFTIIDLAAGYCEFINSARTAGRRYAVDLSPDLPSAVAPGVTAVVASALDFARKIPEKVDAVFVSNFFEHLASPEELLACLGEINRALKPRGLLLVLQPNINLLGSRYWDFIDHKLAINERRMAEAAEMGGFRLRKQILRFLPYTTKSIFPVRPWLVKGYLRLLFIGGPLFGKQSLFLFEKRDAGQAI